MLPSPPVRELTEASPETVPAEPARSVPGDQTDALIMRASRALSEYQHLTAAGRLADAGQRLEELKQALDELGLLVPQ